MCAVTFDRKFVPPRIDVQLPLLCFAESHTSGEILKMVAFWPGLSCDSVGKLTTVEVSDVGVHPGEIGERYSLELEACHTETKP